MTLVAKCIMKRRLEKIRTIDILRIVELKLRCGCDMIFCSHLLPVVHDTNDSYHPLLISFFLCKHCTPNSIAFTTVTLCRAFGLF